MDVAPFITAITALAAAIAFMWRMFHVEHSRTAEKLETRWQECEQKHELTRKEHRDTQNELMVVKVQIGMIEGRMEGYTKARNDLQDMLMEAKGTTLTIGKPTITDGG
jgi:hypothetical protein